MFLVCLFNLTINTANTKSINNIRTNRMTVEPIPTPIPKAADALLEGVTVDPVIDIVDSVQYIVIDIVIIVNNYECYLLYLPILLSLE